MNNNGWIKTDSLTFNIETKALIKYGEMLNDIVIEAAQSISNKHFHGIYSFQSTNYLRIRL